MSKERIYLDRIFSVKKPTQSHRPGVWEAILGTVYAMNENKEIKNFDYDWSGALKFAGITTEKGEINQDRDPRLFRQKERVSYGTQDWTCEPKFNQWVLWVKRS